MNQEDHISHREGMPSLIGRVAIIGFVGGVFWSTIGFFMYYFNFVEISAKSILLRSWLRRPWTDGWLGEVISILMTGILSIAVAYISYFLLRKWYSMWGGVILGAVCWLLVFIVLHPLYPNVPTIYEMQQESIVSTFCLFVIYGVFVGYSIAYDYYDLQIKEMQLNEKKKNAKDS
ncbi:YqhR family membrane protein [Virgibacillus sp. 179-BFC.A HS]|uniref:YqhR family membrane protein n=1 Tax=Tigheibacillus jepli TaxID=3035914 RepID=A0ABU5CH29_9BACI|nr:YqhR family membrane protein [Virgibacillus sp. 179-BFC.A HS]MDY0405601.1 YqhR family membrane protein [Virgibacillus sp. 179-BFC.A HS]